ncbi:MAG: hypothetical protein HKN87_18965 [Saprospiraceae bacterium]|nr:hypothetical protein [Saprospiraceae bacterium]
MRTLLAFALLFLAQQLFSQACHLPASIGIMKPDKFGIRYVESRGNEVQVILEFEKNARIITPENPKDVKGKSVNLRGIYDLRYDSQGGLLSEKRSFLQDGQIPDKGLIFGLNGERGELIDYDLNLIDQSAYDSIPWVAGVRKVIQPEEKIARPDTFFETDLLIDKQSRITELEVTQFARNRYDNTKFDPITETYDFELYDSSDQKKYWTNLYIPVTDPRNGNTTAMLNHFDKKMSKEISATKWRLAVFNKEGRDTGKYEWNFELPMDLAFRLEKFENELDPLAPLEKQIWAFKPSIPTNSAYNEFQYFEFDAHTNLTNRTDIITNHNVFNTIHHIWHKEAVIYASNKDAAINFCYIGDDGESKISSTNARLTELSKLMEKRTQNGMSHAIKLSLAQEVERFDDGTLLVIYQVEENIGVGASFGIAETTNSNMVSHGLVVVHLKPDGSVLAAKYYQRPENADPKAKVVIGPIQRNVQGQISFYAFETTSDGSYPLLYTIRRGNVAIVKNDQGASASRFIYFDADERIVSYFGEIKDPDDPRNSRRTVEVLHDAD